jgi:hypothetical protein
MRKLRGRTSRKLLGMPGVPETLGRKNPLNKINKIAQQTPTRVTVPLTKTPRITQRHECTWAQVAASSSVHSEEQTLPQIIGSLQTILSSVNIKLICASLNSLATDLRNASTPLDKILMVIDTFMAYFSTP